VQKRSCVDVFCVFVDYVKIGEDEADPEIRTPCAGILVYQDAQCIVAEAFPRVFNLIDYHNAE
jgi:hypothetical protein